MTIIVAGNFENKTQADSAVQALLSGGIQSDHICSFRVNPPGQHSAYPIGGDQYASPETAEAGDGALKGAAIGGAIGLGAGLVALPIAGPAAVVGGAGIGAYVGSLAGALKKMGPEEEGGSTDAEKVDETPHHPAGVLVAVEAPIERERAFAADVLREKGAREVEETEGTWRDGLWVDYDPTVHRPERGTDNLAGRE
jgi:hypothetical protein